MEFLRRGDKIVVLPVASGYGLGQVKFFRFIDVLSICL